MGGGSAGESKHTLEPKLQKIDGGGRRVLVSGATGLLGRTLLATLQTWPGWLPLAAGRRPAPDLDEVPHFELDLRNRASIAAAVAAAAPDVVIHTAALTDVDGCERDPQAAWAVNVEGTAAVAAAAAAAGARLIHLSTEYVFDGTDGPYAETARPNPQGVYARGKLASEERVAAAGGRWTVARTTVLYGCAPGARPDFARWLIDRLAAGERARVVADQIGSPTLADNLAEMLLALAANEADGVFHTVGATCLSRYAFARRLAEHFDLDPAAIDPITTAELAQPAPRPLRAGLRTERYAAACPRVPPLPLDVALALYHDRLAAAGTLPVRRT